MTQEQKAQRYDYLVAEGDRLNRELSKIKANNIQSGNNPDVDKQIDWYKSQLAKLESEVNSLF